jgi:hypothetical protein
MRSNAKCMMPNGPSVARRLLQGLLLSAVWLFGQTGSTTVSSTAAIVLNRHGCVPQNTIVLAGTVMLEVINRTGFDSMTFHVTPVATQSTTATTQSPVLNSAFANTYLHDGLLNLGAGSYQLTVDNQPRWTCSITVQ